MPSWINGVTLANVAGLIVEDLVDFLIEIGGAEQAFHELIILEEMSLGAPIWPSMSQRYLRKPTCQLKARSLSCMAGGPMLKIWPPWCRC